MTEARFAAVILAAGKGTRMRSRRPKVLHEIAGKSLIGHVLDALGSLNPAREIVVLAPGMEEVACAVSPRPAAIQDLPLGTGHALRAAMPLIADFDGPLLVVYADTPLVRAATLARLVERLAEGADLALMGFRPADAGAYGRILAGQDGRIERIVEFAETQGRAPGDGLCNGGLMAIGPRARTLLTRIGNDNAKGEYYLTDIVHLAAQSGLAIALVEADEEEVLGVNSKAELAEAEAVIQDRLRRRWLEAGVTMTAPETVYLSSDTVLAPDVAIGPFVVIGPGVTIEEGAEIRAFSDIAGAHIGAGATVGPFARLRAGTVLGEKARIGNFVEVKNTAMGEGAKANHLSYLGDALIGAGANIGAGTITCNYDGFGKARTEIGARAFIGSNTALVAPVVVGAGAIVGAGSTITRDVAPDALVVARAEPVERPGGAKAFRETRVGRKIKGGHRSKKQERK